MSTAANADDRLPTPGSMLVSAVENFWASLTGRHSELPARVVVVTGSGSSKKTLTLGHWAKARWTAEAGLVPELFVSGECIADGPVEVATTVIHEAAHALLLARGDDSAGTSRQGRYHTMKGFVSAARELGLVPPVAPHGQYGFSNCTLAPATQDLYSAEIAALGKALGNTRIIPAVKPRGYVRSQPLACNCRLFQVGFKVARNLGDLICSRCNAPLAQVTEEVARDFNAVMQRRAKRGLPAESPAPVTDPVVPAGDLTHPLEVG